MTVEAIKELIEHLPPEEQTVLACWMSVRGWRRDPVHPADGTLTRWPTGKTITEHEN